MHSRDATAMIARARELVVRSREQRDRCLLLRQRIRQTAERVVETRDSVLTVNSTSRELLRFSKIAVRTRGSSMAQSKGSESNGSKTPDMATALNSWKEIARFMGKGVRTVQRWEQQLGLPVHRLDSDGKAVFALPDELNQWAHRYAQPKEHTWELYKRHIELRDDLRRLRQISAERSKAVREEIRRVRQRCQEIQNKRANAGK